MVFKDYNDIVYQTFVAEYRCSEFPEDKEFWWRGFGWRLFLENKDIGIEHCPNLYNTDARATYKIINEKKWTIARLKYGI